MSADDMPEQPKTMQIPAADPVLVAVADLTREVRGARADIQLVSNDLSIVKDRVTVLETERTKMSGGVRGLSTASAEHDAQLAQERAARTELAAKVDQLAAGHATLNEKQDLQLAILARLDKVASNPTVKVLAGMAATAALTWLASHGGHL